MAQPIATIDTSVLVSLQSAELLGAASVLFGRLLVPAKVRAELEAGGEANRAALAAIDDFAIFEPCDDYDPALVKWLLDTRANLRAGRDQGEAEAVIQAAQRSASMVLVDDQLGARVGQNARGRMSRNHLALPRTASPRLSHGTTAIFRENDPARMSPTIQGNEQLPPGVRRAADHTSRISRVHVAKRVAATHF